MSEASARTAALEGEAAYRYGIVFLLVLSLVAFVIIAPAGPGARAIGFAIEALALLVVAATSRAPVEARRRQALAVAFAGAVLAVLIATGTLPDAAIFAINGLLAAAIPFTLVGGLIRLLRGRGVSAQAVAGALAVYLLVGLLFAWLVVLIANIEGVPYFAQQRGVTASSAVYFSFTVMTTTGFGDLTAVTRLGRALAVLEEVIGQIYVVVVIGVLVGSLAGRARS